MQFLPEQKHWPDNNYSSVLGNVQQKQLLKTFTISGREYSLDDFPNFVIFKRDNNHYNRYQEKLTKEYQNQQNYISNLKFDHYHTVQQ